MRTSPPFSDYAPGTSRAEAAWVGVKNALKFHGHPQLLRFRRRLRPSEPRRIHLYGVGAQKSGTHSLANLFAEHYRAAHEPDALALIPHLLHWLRGGYSDVEARRLLRDRDAWLGLEVEAAFYLSNVVELLVDLFPDARFVLTIRDPYRWLNSALNQDVRAYKSPHPNRALHLALSDFRYGRNGYAYDPEEAHLRSYPGVYPVAEYLDHWTRHNERVLSAVHEERLFVLRTDQIGKRTDALARFVGVDPDTLTVAQAHAYAHPRREPDAFELLPQSYLDEQVQRRCGGLMERFFPEISSLNDVTAPRAR